MTAWDWLVIAGYAAFIIGIGWRAGRGSKSGEGHLRAERSLPAWAVVFSILATEISAATYTGVPQKGFDHNWNYLSFTVGSAIGKLVLAIWFIQLYWRLNLTSVYGLLGARIGPRTQRACAWAFLGGRLIASGVRLYIAALALEPVCGLGLGWSMALITVISTAYTFIGGLKAVVWTDVAQGSIYVVGALAALCWGLHVLDQSVFDALGDAWRAHKFQVFTLDDDGKGWLASNRPWPVAMTFSFFLVLASHGTDQENVQHMLNTKSAKGSMRSVFFSGLFALPIVALFLSVGTMLWLYHRQVPNPGYDLSDSRQIFPNFILHAMPSGLRGLVFAGLFAAAISHLGAMLNAAATIWITDVRGERDLATTRLARVRRLIVVFGVLLLAVGAFFAWRESRDKSELIETALSAMTILYGGILGVFLTALFFDSRGSDLSTVAGLLVGIAIGALGFFQKELFHWTQARVDWAYTIPVAALATILVAATGARRTAAETNA